MSTEPTTPDAQAREAMRRRLEHWKGQYVVAAECRGEGVSVPELLSVRDLANDGLALLAALERTEERAARAEAFRRAVMRYEIQPSCKGGSYILSWWCKDQPFATREAAETRFEGILMRYYGDPPAPAPVPPGGDQP